MYRVTTPTYTFTLPIQTSACKEILITLKQSSIELEKHYENSTLPDGMTLNGKDVYIHLTQEETKAFNTDHVVKAQVRVLTNDNEAFASQMINVYVNDVLNEEILKDD